MVCALSRFKISLISSCGNHLRQHLTPVPLSVKDINGILGRESTQLYEKFCRFLGEQKILPNYSILLSNSFASVIIDLLKVYFSYMPSQILKCTEGLNDTVKFHNTVVLIVSQVLWVAQLYFSSPSTQSDCMFTLYNASTCTQKGV